MVSLFRFLLVSLVFTFGKTTRILGILLFLATPILSTPSPEMSIKDELLFVGEDRFVVMRTTDYGFGTYYKRRTSKELVEISVWNGRVLARCFLQDNETTYTHDVTNKNGGSFINSQTTDLRLDPQCPFNNNFDMAVPYPLEATITNIEIKDGSLSLSSKGKVSILANKNFILTRLESMAEAEMKAGCKSWDEEEYHNRFGCGNMDEPNEVGDLILATDDRVFIQIISHESDSGWVSKYWLAINRMYWDDLLE